jgi:hypothetical protein
MFYLLLLFQSITTKEIPPQLKGENNKNQKIEIKCGFFKRLGY